MLIALGSQCIVVDGLDILTGDTLFPGSCGHIDLDDSDPQAMFHSLRLLAALPDDLVVWPGHSYGGEKSTIAAEKQTGLLREAGTGTQDHFLPSQL